MKRLLVIVFVGAQSLPAATIQEVFTHIYTTRFWMFGGNRESVSGPGSTMKETVIIREELPKILKKYDIQFFVDAPCGDFNWMKAVDLSSVEQYLGLDVVIPLIDGNKQKYTSDKVSFAVCDITSDPLPKADLFLCRDCLQHLSDKQVMSFVMNLKESGVRYLLATSYQKNLSNSDIKAGQCRSANLELVPFNFPQPLEVIFERFNDKYVCLWLVADLPEFVI